LEDIKDQLGHKGYDVYPKVIYLEVYDIESKNFHKPRQFIIKKYEAGVTYNCTYTLDSAVLRNTEGYHFSAYITCNGDGFGFDGESFSRLEKFNWKSKLNKNIKWRFAKQFDTFFNFTDGYQLLIYYLTKREPVL